MPAESGTLMDISKFDAAFFGVPPKLVDNMDPQLRIMLELTHEALVDSGNYPLASEVAKGYSNVTVLP